MKISNLLNRLDSVISESQLRLTIIPPKLIECGVVARPGLSAIRMTQNILKDLSAAGFPIEENTDGSPNMMNQFVYHAISNGVLNEVLKNGVIQVPVPLGETSVTLLGIMT